MSWWETWLERFRQLLPALMVWVVLGILGILLIQAAPPVKRLLAVVVKANADGSTLGWQELGQYPGANSAEKNHLRVKYDRDRSMWLLQNVATHKRIDAKTDKLDTRYIRHWALQTGDKLVSEHFSLEVQQADNGRLVIQDAANKMTGEWSGTALLLNGKAGHPGCEQSSYLKRVGTEFKDWLAWNIWRDKLTDEKRLFSYGGQVTCTTRWPQQGVKPDSLRFTWMDKRFWVGPGASGERVRVERGEDKRDLNAVQLPVSGEDGKVKRLILGRTHFRLDVEADRLALTPTANQPVFIQASEGEQLDEKLTEEERKAKAAQAKLDEEKAIKDMADRGIFPNYEVYDWIGDSAGKKPGMMNLVLAFVITVFLTHLIMASRQDGHAVSRFGRLLGTGITLLLLVLSTLLASFGASLGTLLFLAWFSVLWATIVQFIAGRLQGKAARIWLLVMSLAGIGLLVLAQLAVGADSTRWLAYPADSAFWLIQLAGWVALLALTPVGNLLESLMKVFDPEHRVRFFGWTLPHYAYVFLLVGVLGLIVVQGLVGSEEGVWGVQPVELAKLVFVVAAARLLWFWQHHRSLLTGHYRENWLLIGAGLLGKMLVALMLGVLILVFGVQDNSPILIVLCLSMALLWLAFVDPLAVSGWGKWWWRATFIGLPLLVLLALAVWAYLDPPGYGSPIPQAERLRIWSNPALYPEAAAQLLNSLQRVGEGGWWGTGWFGKNGAVMTVPAVQDDFIAAFLLNRFGSLPGIVLVTVQFFWLLALFRLAAGLLSIETRADVASACRLMGYVLFGLAWLHLLHWLVSWGNVLGLLPIMGQPMTWLSAGNSHLLAVGMPTLLLALLAGWVLQELGEE